MKVLVVRVVVKVEVVLVLVEVMVVLVVVQWELVPLTSTLSPEYVSELTALRLPCVRLRNCGMKREVRVSRSVMRSIFERLCSSMLVWSSCVCCGCAGQGAVAPPLTSVTSGRLPPSKKYSYCKERERES